MPYLMLISIGPVQEFIASARRSRDLWFGSWLLSELSKTVARVIDAQGGTLIFPAPASPADDLKPDSPLNVANKIIAELPDTDETKIKEVACDVQQAIKDRLTALWDDPKKRLQKTVEHISYSKLDPTIKRKFQDALQTEATDQITDLIEVAWVAMPLEENTYAEVRATLEHLLAARKATRSFQPVGAWSQAGRPKSSLDGLRESVIPEDIYDQFQQGRLTELELFRSFGVRRGERLCGVGLLKRHGRREDKSGGRVFSTSHVAALPLLERLDTRHQAAVDRYIDYLQAIGLDEELGDVPIEHGVFKCRDQQQKRDRYCDGHLLFEERLSEYIASQVQLREAKEELKHLRKAINGDKDFVPLPYYALLHADGDGMGKAIEAQTTQPGHQALSRQLNGFAHQVSGIIAEHKGSLVYAGGDDVLAFVPLHTVLDCARMLAERFKEALKDYEYTEEEANEKRHPTLSVGIAITHHLEPLSDALALARDAEQRAKAYPGKNALAVALSKRSGEERVVVGGWDEQYTAIGALDARLQRFAELYADAALPDGFAYELALLHRHLTPARNPTLAAGLHTPMIDAARRILDRKRTDQAGTQKLDDATAAQLRDLIGQLPLDRLADELIVARMFASALRQTGKAAFHEFAPAPLQPQEVL